MTDPIVGKTPEGRPIYKDEKGETYTLSDIGPFKPKADIIKPKADIIKPKSKEKEIMAEESGLVTQAQLMRRDMDGMKKELEAKIATGREVDQEIKGKVLELDGKVCKGEECYARIEKKQDDMLKILEDRFKILSEPRFICRKCHASSIRKGDKACSVCGDAVDVVWN